MFLIGLFITAFSLPLTISMFRNVYILDARPFYTINGMTAEEAAVMAIIFLVLTLVGLILVIFGWIRRKNKAILNSIVNVENQSFCSDCNINVAENYENCPICGKILK